MFEIHIDKNIVGSIKPNMSSLGLVPIMMSALRATLWWRLHFSTAMAAIREPGTLEVSHQTLIWLLVTYKHHVGLLEVGDAHILGGHDLQQREENHG